MAVDMNLLDSAYRSNLTSLELEVVPKLIEEFLPNLISIFETFSSTPPSIKILTLRMRAGFFGLKDDLQQVEEVLNGLMEIMKLPSLQKLVGLTIGHGGWISGTKQECLVEEWKKRGIETSFILEVVVEQQSGSTWV